MQTRTDIIKAIEQDPWRMSVLKAVKSLELPDCWVAAGFVRSKIWDVLHGFEERTPLADVDVVYFDPSNTDEAVEKRLEEKLRNLLPNVPWSVKNEARMHRVNDFEPYQSAVDAISKFPETVTALGVALSNEDWVMLTAPHGVDDVLHMEVRPAPFFIESPERLKIYQSRIKRKNWPATWNKVTLHDE